MWARGPGEPHEHDGSGHRRRTRRPCAAGRSPPSEGAARLGLGWRESLGLARTALPDLIFSTSTCLSTRPRPSACAQADPRTAGIPVIFLSGAMDVQTKVHCFDLGAIDYVTKPFTLPSFRARVRSAPHRATRTPERACQARRAHQPAQSRLFRRVLQNAMTDSARLDRPCSLVLLDLDRFKSLNDRLATRSAISSSSARASSSRSVSARATPLAATAARSWRSSFRAWPRSSRGEGGGARAHRARQDETLARGGRHGHRQLRHRRDARGRRDGPAELIAAADAAPTRRSTRDAIASSSSPAPPGTRAFARRPSRQGREERRLDRIAVENAPEAIVASRRASRPQRLARPR